MGVAKGAIKENVDGFALLGTWNRSAMPGKKKFVERSHRKIEYLIFKLTQIQNRWGEMESS